MADGIQWTSHFEEFDGGRLAYFAAGLGEPVVFVSGGPGDSHAYLRPVAAEFAAEYQCVLYDQRGTGQSVHDLSAQTLNVDALVRDLDHVREILGSPDCAWSAILGEPRWHCCMQFVIRTACPISS